jgi:adenine/guanine phosphoribosyltransferase-like PRPP-binding protein
MTALTETTPPAVLQSRDERLSDLASDLRAAGGYLSNRTPAVALSRPAILRRIGALLASSVPPGTDRIACTQEDTLIGVAVSLHTGVPLVIVLDNETSIGELHRTENVAGVGYSEASHDTVARSVREAGGTLTAMATVFNKAAGGPDGATSALFTVP